jgi:hypothetical protein
MKTAIAFLCKEPQQELISFAEQIVDNNLFDVYIITDNDYCEFTNVRHYNLKIISISDAMCKKFGFINSNISDNSTHIKKNPIAYDKALLYFCGIKTNYEKVWFIEDDVFIPSVEHLVNLNNRYASCDLITANNFAKTDNIKDWHWAHIFDKIEPPYYHSMVCVCGCSRKMLNTIFKYVEKNNTLFYIEAMFNTLAMQNNLIVADAFELKSIVWQGEWGLDEFLLLPNNLFHPVKATYFHQTYRGAINLCKQDKDVELINKLPEFITTHPEFKSLNK